MEITETFHAANREQWRDWLARHHETSSEVWLISYRKATGRRSVSYNDAVEEALCFGWIDSTRKGIDAVSYAQRYCPRRAGSAFSQLNQERICRLRERGLLVENVIEETSSIRPHEYTIPADILARLSQVEGAREFFDSTSPSYQRIRAAYVEGARNRPDEFEKRLRHLVERSARGQQFGYGIDSYF